MTRLHMHRPDQHAGVVLGRWIALGVVAVLGIATSAAAGPASSAEAASSLVTDQQAYDSVNMWVGTKYDTSQNKGNSAYANTWPGAGLPFGMTQFSPTTYTSSTGSARGGYEYDSDQLRGFGMTRISGTGCENNNSEFDIPLLPYTGSLTNGVLPTSPGSNIKKYYLNYSHDKESSQPGYYSVDLDNGVDASLTSTLRSTVGTFDYSSSTGSSQTLLLNASGSNNDSGETSVSIDPSTRTISGYTTSKTVCSGGTYRIYFSAQFDTDFTSYGTWNGNSVNSSATSVVSSAGKDQSGAYLTFPKDAKITVATGLSYVSVANAALNRSSEVGAFRADTFDTTRAAAESTWKSALTRIRISADDSKTMKVFYTAIYHSMLEPTTYDDVNGQYRAFAQGTTMTDKVETVSSGHHEYVTFSGWDTYRGEMQLIAMLFPGRASDIAQSLVDLATQSGSWYNWPHLGSGQNKMSGDSLQTIVAELYAMGATDFDTTTALNSMVAADSLPSSGSTRDGGLVNSAVGWVEDRTENGTSKTLEYATTDFAVSQFAAALGDSKNAKLLLTRAQNWQNLVDSSQHEIVPRDRKGLWSDFDLSVRSSSDGKVDSGANSQQFEQSTGYQYQWEVPFNVSGLVTALGGKSTVSQKLDTYFTKLDDGVYGSKYAYLSNEVSMNAPYIYEWLGEPAKTTQVLDRIADELYDDTPGGLEGNDDLGALSSYYVWGTIGLYPGIYGTAEMLTSAPRVSESVITPEGHSERSITVTANDVKSSRNISGLSVNGTATDRTSISANLVKTGGTVTYTLSSAASDWGTSSSSAPSSYTDESDARNATGISTDDTAGGGSMDFSGNALSAGDLAKQGAVAGAKLDFSSVSKTLSGITYDWTDAGSGEPDSWIPHEQTISMGGKKLEKISFLGTATNGPSQGYATVVYTDGSTKRISVYFSDWTPSDTSAIDPTDTIVLTSNGRNTSSGGKDSTKAYLYATKPVNLDATKSVESVILPSSSSSGVMHLFSIGTEEAADQGDAGAPASPSASPSAGGSASDGSGTTNTNTGQGTAAAATGSQASSASPKARAAGADSGVSVHTGGVLASAPVLLPVMLVLVLLAGVVVTIIAMRRRFGGSAR